MTAQETIELALTKGGFQDRTREEWIESLGGGGMFGVYQPEEVSQALDDLVVKGRIEIVDIYRPVYPKENPK